MGFVCHVYLYAMLLLLSLLHQQNCRRFALSITLIEFFSFYSFFLSIHREEVYRTEAERLVRITL